MPTYDQWSEWQVRCAAARCAPTTAAALRTFGGQRLRHYARLAPESAAAKMLPDAAACWHLFETRLAAGRTRQGCSYKQWLFARAQGAPQPLDAIQGGASLLLRDVARDYIRCECPPPNQVSLDAAIPETNGRLTYADLLPDHTALTTEDADDLAVAQTIARSFFVRLNPRERLVLLIRRMNISLCHPAIAQLSGLSQSGIYKLWRTLHVRLAEKISRRHPAENRAAHLRLALRAAEWLGELALVWGQTEKHLAQLATLAQETQA